MISNVHLEEKKKKLNLYSILIISLPDIDVSGLFHRTLECVNSNTRFMHKKKNLLYIKWCEQSCSKCNMQ